MTLLLTRYGIKSSLRAAALLLALSQLLPLAMAQGKSPADLRKLWSPYMTPRTEKNVDQIEEPELVDLGRHLFFERALSPEQDRSCNDCHELAKYGTNGPLLIQARKEKTLWRDVPSIYNLAGAKLLGWDGAHTNLAEKQRILSPPPRKRHGEPDGTRCAIKRNPEIPGALYSRVWARGGQAGHLRAGSALPHRLSGGPVTAPSPFDKLLSGDDKALTEEQLKGAFLFDAKNCSACHTGSHLGGQMIQIAGIAVPWPNQKDQGLFEQSGDPAHRMGFRVPPLRNVAATPPYFHDASSKYLTRAVGDIARYEMGMLLDFKELLLIEAFLESFTGPIPEDYIRPPEATK